MKAHSPIIIVLVVIILSITDMSAQKLLQKADKLYNLQYYDRSINAYTEFLESNPAHIGAKEKLADCYRLSNQLVQAKNMYAELVKLKNVDPVVIRNFGLTLMKMAQYEDALYYFDIYKIYDPEEGNHYSLSCEYAKHLYNNEEKYSIDLLDINTPNSDFGVTFLGNNFVFSSYSSGIDEKGVNSMALNGNIIYISDIDENNNLINTRFYRAELNDNINVGPISFSKNESLQVYSKNKIKEGGTHITGNDSKLNLFVSEWNSDEEQWNESYAFPYNEFGVSTGFPNVSADGSAIYFASNRIGGYGGYDIYVSYWKDNQWTYPQNLGSEINTKGNEISPYYTNGTIYFASDYHHGMGGYDIFQSNVLRGNWSHPTNLGNGVNSSCDDFYPAMKESKNKIYFSSNRLGGYGKEDIYVAIKYADKPDIYSSVDRKIQSTYTTIGQRAVVQDNTNLAVINTSGIIDQKTNKEKISNHNGDMSHNEHLQESRIENDLIDINKDDEEIPIAYKLPVLNALKSNNVDFDISKARRVAINEILPSASQVYFIQLAALYRSKGDMSAFSNLRMYGNIYKFYKSNSVKIKLGYFFEKKEAIAILEKVKTKGYVDAFITKNYLNSGELELVIGSNSNNSNVLTQPPMPASTRLYKVRLASYEDPIWFDIQSANTLGQIEQWTKGGWTIFILGSFQNFENAELARIKAINKGFTDAEVVIDNNGILERLRKN